MQKRIIHWLVLVLCLLPLTVQASTILLSKTGQVVSYGSGDDGAIQKGLAWPTPRFTDNSDGTVTDNMTGLIWLKNANCFGAQTWTDSLTSANTLASGACGLTDSSTAGDWLLPNAEQMESLVDISRSSPALPVGHPFSGVQSSIYWSSATSVNSPSYAWYVHFADGFLSYTGKGNSYYAWPLRAGQILVLDSLTVSIKGSTYFGALEPNGTPVVREVTLKNNGASDLSITLIEITGADPTDFSVATGGASPCESFSPTIAAGGSCTVNVIFIPTYGSKIGSLTITANSKSINLFLTGSTLLPDTTITDKPASLSNTAGPEFIFTSTIADSTFECRLDSESFAACPTPKTYAGLAEGSHTFYVQAIDPGANIDPTPASWTWTIDTTAPDTTINNKPSALTNSASASFAFFANDASATFECQLDSSGFAVCTSSKVYTGLAEGSHTFAVRAIDLALNPDPTPASWTWRIDTIPPETTINSNPADPTNSTTASFAFSSSEADSTFECRLDSESFAVCTSFKVYTGLAEGSHTFAVRAIDLAGNTDLIPATWTWTIDTIAPFLEIDAVDSPTPRKMQVVHGSMETGSIVSAECSTASVGPISYPSESTWVGSITNLTIGNNTIVITAGDTAGNYATADAAIEIFQPALGDFNIDQTVDMTDVILSLQVLSGLPTEQAVFWEADVNGDNKIGLEDVFYILYILAHEP